jgi:hypothetical protein
MEVKKPAVSAKFLIIQLRTRYEEAYRVNGRIKTHLCESGAGRSRQSDDYTTVSIIPYAPLPFKNK